MAAGCERARSSRLVVVEEVHGGGPLSLKWLEGVSSTILHPASAGNEGKRTPADCIQPEAEGGPSAADVSGSVLA